jgi:hypothetical protein
MRLHLRPVDAVWIDQIALGVPRHDDRKVIADAFVKAESLSQAQRCRQIAAQGGDRLRFGHGRSLQVLWPGLLECAAKLADGQERRKASRSVSAPSLPTSQADAERLAELRDTSATRRSPQSSVRPVLSTGWTRIAARHSLDDGHHLRGTRRDRDGGNADPGTRQPSQRRDRNGPHYASPALDHAAETTTAFRHSTSTTWSRRWRSWRSRPDRLPGDHPGLRGARAYAHDVMLKHMMDAVSRSTRISRLHSPGPRQRAADLHDRDPGRLYLCDDGRLPGSGRQDPGDWDYNVGVTKTVTDMAHLGGIGRGRTRRARLAGNRHGRQGRRPRRRRQAQPRPVADRPGRSGEVRQGNQGRRPGDRHGHIARRLQIHPPAGRRDPCHAA